MTLSIASLDVSSNTTRRTSERDSDQAAEAPRHPTPVCAPVPNEVLSFRLDSESYGIDILQVQEIRSFEACTGIAGSPAYMRGVVNLRGVIVPVIDLRLKFGLACAGADGGAATIVLNVGGSVVGVVVDSVSDVVELQAAQVQPLPPFAAGAHRVPLTGIATVQQADVQRMLLLIDLRTLLTQCGVGAGVAAA